jgi:Protein of unknown function (DUF3106)
MIRALLICMGLYLAAANGSLAQNAPAPAAWGSLSPGQQQLLQRFKGDWDTLPAERRQALVKGSQRWLSMSPDERANAQQRFGQWRAMPPEQRQLLRQRWQRFQSLPPDQQQRVRESFRRFREIPPERRRMLRKQWRQMSIEQRRKIIETRKERRNLR